MDPRERIDLIRIKLAPMDERRWNEQKEAVKAITGATFHKGTGAWTIETNRDDLAVETLNRLYEIAAEYGTHVRIILGNE